MDSIYGKQEEYLGMCGELFLTIKGNIAFHCTFCDKRFKNFQGYNDHILETHFVRDMKTELLEEYVNEDEEIYDQLCGETYSIDTVEFSIKIEKQDESQNLDETFSQLEDSTSEESKTEGYQTEDSNPVIMSEMILNEAIRPTIRSVNIKPTSKDRKFKCPYCDFTGTDKANVRGHIKRHSLNKPHKCIECGKAFYTRTEVKVHMRVHTGERPFLCNLCGRSFVTSGKLNDHQKRHNNKRDRVCPHCNMAFVNSNELRGHMVVHSDNRDFKCTLCEASFKISGGLKNHMKLHDNKRAYQCKLCDAKFNQNAGLYSHMKSCHTVVYSSPKAS